jgi:hypothetical protein
MLPRFIVLFSCIAIILLQSCGKSSLPISAETILQPAKGGDFRGVKLGDKPKIIKRQEEASSVYSMPDELIYRFETNEADSTCLDVYPQNESLKEHLLNDFISYYDQRFGTSNTKNAHHEWRGLTVQGHYVTVSLLKDSTGNKPNHLRLVFNETNP